MLVDSITLVVKAGDGGSGASTFLRNGQTAKGGPDGGNGGNGGNVYFLGSTNITDLREFRYKKKINAEDGVAGKKHKLFGKNADNTTIEIPLGTQITDTYKGKVYEITDTKNPLLIARGGSGGRGNAEFKSVNNQAPTSSEKGTKGEEKILQLELKLIAQIGLVGLPNGGKSSMLKLLTNANPKIGDYPFTTLEPNIGIFKTFAIADIPGLIEGASSGKGLGITFLKHIEKTKILLHLIDATGENLDHVYSIIRSEFGKYNPLLLTKPEIIIFTKIDLIDEKTLQKKIKIFTKKGLRVLPYSIYRKESINLVKAEVVKLLKL